jgi:hypothetical protein
MPGVAVTVPVHGVADEPESEVESRSDDEETSFDVRAWVEAFAPMLHEPAELTSDLIGVPLS